MENEEILEPNEINTEKQPNTHKKLKIFRNVAIKTCYTLLASSLIAMGGTCVKVAAIAQKSHEQMALIEELGEQSQEFKDTIAYELNDNQNKFLNGEITSREYENQVSKLNSKEHKREVIYNVSDVDLTNIQDLQKEMKAEEIKMAHCLQTTIGCWMLGAASGLGAVATHLVYDIKTTKTEKEPENKELEV